jgi:hypothetical protein
MDKADRDEHTNHNENEGGKNERIRRLIVALFQHSARAMASLFTRK